MKMINKLIDLFLYIVSGSRYLNWGINIINTVTIQYALLGFGQYFPNIIVFSIVVGSIMTVVFMIGGWLDYNYVTYRRQPVINPYAQDILKSRLLMNKAFQYMIEGDNKQANTLLYESNKIINRWIE